MQVFRSLDEIPSNFGRSVVAIGNFDGVHLGHRAILEEVRRRAAEQGAASVAVTFDPHPVRVLRPELAPKLITPMPQRLELLAKTGIDAVLILPFTEEFSRTPARVFADQVLARGLRAVEVHEGESFRFGHKAEAGTEDLVVLGREFGFGVFGHRVLRVRGIAVSSSEVRQQIQAGKMNVARALLGRLFSIESMQERGRGVGSKLLVPTINLAQYDELTPAHGVYVTRVRVGERWFAAVTNCGVRPTFGVESFAIESYLLDFVPVEMTAETPVEVCFVKRLREERKFDSAEALKEQIGRDVARAKRYHAKAFSY
jgi:riboflavin kinase/FMN adenylyltransferase